MQIEATRQTITLRPGDELIVLVPVVDATERDCPMSGHTHMVITARSRWSSPDTEPSRMSVLGQWSGPRDTGTDYTINTNGLRLLRSDGDD